ncbi:MAG TPA: TonB-dependent receptor [Candidatus Coprenecus stercoravium]|uniref:TonB-dependent receptor n=1 Tax=Candidatus Coprenecus stercoravium TaxID=2840735 RepID=A0A9D2GPY2_9BACT|nr:TonB-dependent receptor [Candidatus Coprenecus stercoravium]
MKYTATILRTAAVLLLCLITGIDAKAVEIYGADADSTGRGWNEELSPVVVTGTRNKTDIRHLPLTVSILERPAIEYSYTPSLLPVLTEQVPGFFSTSRGVMGYGVSDGAAGNISIRGLSGGSGRVMVLIDGHPQYMGMFGHPISDSYQSLMAEQVEVLRGPASVLYGSNAMGGVVNIVTRKMEHDGVRTSINAGYGSWNTVQTEVTNRVRYKGFSSIVSVSYNRTDGHRPDMGFEQYGGYAKLGYDFKRNWKVRGDVNVTHFNASNPGTVGNPLADADQSITRGMTSLAIENEYERTSGAVSVFYNWGRHRVNDGYHPLDSTDNQPLDYRFNSIDDMMGISAYQSVRLFKGNRLTAGVDWYRFGGSAWNQYVQGDRTGERDDIIDMTQHEVAGYVDFRQNIGRWVTLDAGLRVDHHSHVGTEWVPQAGVSVHLPYAVEVKLSAGKGFRYPLIREMFMWGSANAALRPERMWNYELAVSQKLLGGRLSYGVNVFYIDGDNFIMTQMTDGRPQNVNAGALRNAGVEAQAAWRISGDWSVDANYSYLHMKYPVVAAPEHKLYVGGAFSHGRWYASTGVQYIAGLYTQTGADPVQEDFVLWNVRASFRILDWMSVWVRGENLLNWQYEINAGFPMPGANVIGGLSFDF